VKVLFFYIDTQIDAGYTTGLGIASISGYLKAHGVSTELVYFRNDLDLAYAMEKLEVTSPDIVGYYSVSVSWRTVRLLAREVRMRRPTVFQVYGGIHTTLVPESLLEIADLDALCVGYGEEPMLELAERLDSNLGIADISGLWVKARGPGAEAARNPAHFARRNPDELLRFDHDLFLNELQRFPNFRRDRQPLEIIFNRSCPFQCTFCCNHRLKEIYGNRRFVPSPQASIRSLVDSLARTGLRSVAIHDDILTGSKRWFREFSDLYSQEVGLPFVCNVRADCLSEDDVLRLKKMGASAVWIGVESGNDYIRNTVMQKRLEADAILQAVGWLHDSKIAVRIQNIIGVPEETPERFLDTIRLNAQCAPAFHALSVFYPYPNTLLHDVCVRENLISTDDYGQVVERRQAVVRLPGFSARQVHFYFVNFRRLIAYQRRRFRHPILFFLPLCPQTSGLIAAIVAAFEGAKGSPLVRAARRIWQALTLRSLSTPL
jgi:anaerobic magnesium-protoporphyrin IX monomethyl ester cyclase